MGAWWHRQQVQCCPAASILSTRPATIPRPLPLYACPFAGGFLLTYSLSRALTLPEPSARSIAIQAGLRNSALAAQLAMLHFPAFPLAALPCALSACVHSVLGSLLASWWQARVPNPAPPEEPAGGSALLALAAAVCAPAGAAARAASAAVAGLRPPARQAAAPGAPPRRARANNPYAMNIIMVGAECAPWSKTGALVGWLWAFFAPPRRSAHARILRGVWSRHPPHPLVTLLLHAALQAAWAT
jgi:hypothetical protein